MRSRETENQKIEMSSWLENNTKKTLYLLKKKNYTYNKKKKRNCEVWIAFGQN